MRPGVISWYLMHELKQQARAAWLASLASKASK